MAKWQVTPGTVGNTLKGEIQYDNHGSTWKIEQNVDEFKEQAKRDREAGDGKHHIKKMYSIPEVVAIEIKKNYGIDVFAPTFMHDAEQKMRVHLIIQQEYPYLMSTDKRV